MIGMWRWGMICAALAISALAASRPAEASVDGSARARAPIPASTLALMRARNTDAAAPILMRTYKKEAELEIWKKAGSGRYVLLETFPICRWSGELGPKRHEGDRQTPEGFYSIAPRQMNPNSHYYLSFDVGFPNAYDRAHHATGSAVMVHGICSSAGCFAMTDRQAGEIYAIAREAFAGGQAAFQFQSYPFRMSAENMARYRADPNIGFWRELKEGSDRFEATGDPLVVGVSGARYTFARSEDPVKEELATSYHEAEEARVAAITKAGIAAIRTTYADGGQNPHFAALMRSGVSLGDVSRPEALAFAGREITIIPGRHTRLGCRAATCLAGLPEADPPLILPPDVPPATAVLAASSKTAEPSIFSAAPLGDPDPATGLSAQASMAGSMRIVPGNLTFASAVFDLAATR